MCDTSIARTTCFIWSNPVSTVRIEGRQTLRLEESRSRCMSTIGKGQQQISRLLVARHKLCTTGTCPIPSCGSAASLQSTVFSILNIIVSFFVFLSCFFVSLACLLNFFLFPFQGRRRFRCNFFPSLDFFFFSTKIPKYAVCVCFDLPYSNGSNARTDISR